jgi:signal transduction histidine kinase
MEHTAGESEDRKISAQGTLLDKTILLSLWLEVTNEIVSTHDFRDLLRAVTSSVRRIMQCQCVGVAIRDSGIGIDPNIIGEVFTPFYTTKPGGMGVGLSISRSIVQAHGGRLWAEANAGPGTTFDFSFPNSR